MQRGFDAQSGEENDEARSSFEEALTTFTRAHKADPSRLDARLGIAEAQLALGRADQARSSFDRARALASDNVEAHWGVARALEQLRLKAEGRRKAEQRGRGDGARATLGDRAAEFGFRDEMVEPVREVVRLEPRFELAWLVLSELLTDQGNRGGSLESLRVAVQANPDSARLALAYGSLLQDNGQMAEALAQYERVALSDPGATEVGHRVRAGLLAGAVLIDTDRARQALDYFRAALELSNSWDSGLRAPADAALLYGIGLSLGRLKRYDEALEHLARARTTHGSMSLYSLISQVRLMRQLGQYVRAWQLLREAREAVDEAVASGTERTEPDFARSYAEALRLLGDQAEAIDLYQAALTKDDNAALRTELIATYIEQSERVGLELSHRTPRLARDRAIYLAQARDEFARTRDLYLDALDANRSPRNLVALSGLLMLLGHDEDARPLLEEAIRSGKDEGVATSEQEAAHAHLAMVRARQRDHEGAVREFEAAMRYDPDELLYQIGSAEAHLRLGLLDIAERQYRNVLDFAPGSVEARIGLAEVLTAQADREQPARYELAITQFREAIRLGDCRGTSMVEAREGSISLTAEKLATLHYQIGYAETKLYDADTVRGPFIPHASRKLARAVNAFEEALAIDPGHTMSTAAIARIREERRQHRRELNGSWMPTLILGICLLLLVAIHVMVFVPGVRRALPATFEEQLQPTTYAMLVFGLLVFLIAVASLPQLLKLKVAGIVLEKATVEQARVQLDIGRAPGFSSLQPLKHSRLDVEIPAVSATAGPDGSKAMSDTGTAGEKQSRVGSATLYRNTPSDGSEHTHSDATAQAQTAKQELNPPPGSRRLV